MSIFISYIVLGLSLSAPMGPINAAQLDKGIRFGFLHAWLVGVGGMVADGIFMLLIYFGIAQFIDIPIIKLFLWIFGFFILTYTGIESLLKSGDLEAFAGKNKSETKGKAFRTGFFMAISNPMSILFWLGIYGSILAKTSSSYESWQVLVYSMGIFLGITIWDVTMAGVATGARKLVSPGILRFISIVSGIVLMGFGIYFGVEACRLLFG
ncbi:MULTISPECIES: LysE family transporter [Bacillaceae]|uniref:LysE family transporter n=1 Tax=Bacillaceae TaxID=186817 RepID=UPI001C566C95|nr:LysE family transporter [Rossellomorea sp. YZS02]MBW3110976.1 LysE family translocator [Bacillus sp. MCCB 382]MDX8344276.1 LysE family transporter [Rossellomorea sp. YZS02]